MRTGVVVTLLALLSACASEKMALAPPAGIDFSGHWLLNEADSDDPMRLVQGQLDPSKVTAGPGSPGGQRQGGRGRGAGGGALPGGAPGPTMPAIGALSEGLRWPVRDVDIKQVGGIVTMSSGGIEQIYQPRTGRRGPPHPSRDDSDGHDARPLDRRGDRRGGKPAACGWDNKTLVIEPGDADEDHPPFEERFDISADGQRLIEMVGFKGGRSQGFTMSRVWDRVQPPYVPPSKGCYYADDPKKCDQPKTNP